MGQIYPADSKVQPGYGDSDCIFLNVHSKSISGKKTYRHMAYQNSYTLDIISNGPGQPLYRIRYVLACAGRSGNMDPGPYLKKIPNPR